MIRMEISKPINAPPSFVYNWWTSFEETDPNLSGKIIRSRRIISRTKDTIIFEDQGRMLRVPYKDRVTVALKPPDGWTAEYESNRFHALSTYHLKEVSSGTTLHVVTDVQFKGILRLFAPLAKGLIEKTISNEWDDYAKLIQEDHQKTRSHLEGA